MHVNLLLCVVVVVELFLCCCVVVVVIFHFDNKLAKKSVFYLPTYCVHPDGYSGIIDYCKIYLSVVYPFILFTNNDDTMAVAITN